ncbi:TRAP transporter small permease [Ramlibacter terrae]|uniref:TRAP transporter small permease protein n=1 Tax=Ramlibacter terrae TaxID=2732511 RepID=A0ABX6P5D3_9BURK|nr:TRAP transporter small permease [Ramlibacter terrae]
MALLALAASTVVDIVMRYVFASPIRGFVDIASLAGAVLLAACFPHVLASRGNISIDMLGARLGKGAGRWLDRFGAMVTAGFFAVMAWQYVRFAGGLKSDGQTIPVLNWPVWPWWAAVAALVAAAALVALLTARTPREDAS